MSATEVSTEIKINIHKEEFAEFILNFLGKKEKLLYNDEFTFHLNHNDIEQLYYLVNEKISKEQNTVIEHFIVSISYQDKTEREISGIQSLNKFLESRYVYPISVQLSWNIVVQFPNAQTIENQTIELAFVTNEGYIEQAPSDMKDYVQRNNKNGEGKVFLAIHHTNQAWGIEILNLMKDALNSLKKTKTWQYKVAKKICKFISLSNLTSILLIFAISLMFAVLTTKSTITKSGSEKLYKLSEISEQVSSDEFMKAFIAVTRMTGEDIKKTSDNLIHSSKLKAALNEITLIEEKKEASAKSVLVAFSLVLVALILIAYYVQYVVRFLGSKSHILLTKRSQENFEFEKASKSQTQFYSVGVIVFTIVIGVVTNLISNLSFF